MIVINRDRKFERIESWDDVIGLPGYIETIDPKQTKPVDIFGWYTLDHVKCGLQGCRTPHNRGYVVRTDTGTVTNIGHQCGSATFGVIFDEMANRFEQIRREQEQRERLEYFKARIPWFRERVDGLRRMHCGAAWCYGWLTQFTTKKSPERCPEVVRRRLNGMAKDGKTALTLEREATKDEARARELAAGRSINHPIIIEEPIAEVAGIRALLDEHDLRTLLVDRVDRVLSDFASVEVDLLPAKDLRGWVARLEDVDPSIDTAESAISMAQQFLSPDNLRPFSQLIMDPDERRQFERLITDLQRDIKSEIARK